MKALIVSFYFAPSCCANAKRPYYIARGLLDAGWKVDVVSSFRLMPKDQAEMLKHTSLTIHRIDDPQDRLSRGGNIERFLAKLLRLFLWPDSFLLWSLKIIREVDVSSYDRILICIMPASMLVFSWFKGVNDRWTFDYSESFSSSKEKRISPVARLLRPLLNPLQRKVLRKAGAVLFTSESTRRDYLARNLVSASKAVHVPLFYDDTAYKNKPPPVDRFIIGYTGQFGTHRGVRSPEVFFEALSLFLSRHPEARQVTRFVFHGPWNSIHTPLIRQFELEDVVEINEPVSYARYLELLEDASVLLLVTSSDQNLFVPSKMLDYFGAKRPVLGFVPEDSETRDILNMAGMDGYTSADQDVAGGVIKLELLWIEWRNGCLSVTESGAEQWAFSAQMPKIISILSR
jgi:glycosyltransferase involved in cell wall biosynthesis